MKLQCCDIRTLW